MYPLFALVSDWWQGWDYLQSAASKLHFACSQIARGRSLSAFGPTAYLTSSSCLPRLAPGSATRYNSDKTSDIFPPLSPSFPFTRGLGNKPVCLASVCFYLLSHRGLNATQWKKQTEGEIEMERIKKDEIASSKGNLHQTNAESTTLSPLLSVHGTSSFFHLHLLWSMKKSAVNTSTNPTNLLITVSKWYFFPCCKNKWISELVFLEQSNISCLEPPTRCLS